MAPRSALAGVALCILLGIVLRWPGMDGGFRADDYVQMAALQGEFAAHRAPWDLFRFDGGSAVGARALMEDGYLPWWSSPNLQLSMWRPLSSLLMAADHAVLGPAPFLHHLHSMLWWVALCLIAAWVLRLILPVQAALLATLVFAIDEAHTIPLAWLANRSTLVASAFALLALGLHVRWVRDGHTRARWGSLLAAALALSAGEYALSTLVYLWAYSLVDLDRPLSQRLRTAAPTFLCTCLYLVLRTATGHGAASSGFYIGPFAEPLRFAGAAIQRLPVLYGDALLGMPSSYWNHGAPLRNEVLAMVGPEVFRALPSWQLFQTLLGVLALAGGFGVTRAIARRAGETESRRTVYALAAGALLSAVPAGGSLPDDRLLIGMGIGVSALVGLLASQLLDRVRTGPRVPPLVGLTLLAVVHLGMAATRTRAETQNFVGTTADLRAWSLSAQLPPQPQASQTDVYLIAAADFTTAANLPWVRAAHGASRPRTYRRLSGAVHAHELHRTSDSALELTALSKNLRYAFVGSLYRGVDEPLEPGDRFSLRGLDVEILASVDGNPYRIRFEFDRSLDDPHLLLLQASRRGVVPLTPPAIGERVLCIRPQTPRR